MRSHSASASCGSRRSAVEGDFGSIHEAYEYRVEQLPDRDSDERMKLALWCLNLKLTAEAREQLTTILQRDPNDRQAQSMLNSIEQAATRAALRQRDPQVLQTRAAESTEEKPASLDSGMVRRSAARTGDLRSARHLRPPHPPGDQADRGVCPLRSSGAAILLRQMSRRALRRIIPARAQKSRADRTPDALRANLDAALRLIDQQNPAHSDLLSSTLRPHGRGPRPKPIFPGSNDQTYRILATWVNNLAAPITSDESSRAARSVAS